VLSSATTGRPAASASATSAAILIGAPAYVSRPRTSVGMHIGIIGSGGELG
jgi:hypothetical protein